MFLADTGKKILSSIIVKAQKVRLNPQLVKDKVMHLQRVLLFLTVIVWFSEPKEIRRRV